MKTKKCKPMSQKEYAKNGQGVCPYCRGTDVNIGDEDWMDGSYYIQASCQDCGKHWTDAYNLTGYIEHTEE